MLSQACGGGAEQSPHLREKPSYSGVFLVNNGIGGRFRKTLGRYGGWSESRKDVPELGWWGKGQTGGGGDSTI